MPGSQELPFLDNKILWASILVRGFNQKKKLYGLLVQASVKILENNKKGQKTRLKRCILQYAIPERLTVGRTHSS